MGYSHTKERVSFGALLCHSPPLYDLLVVVVVVVVVVDPLVPVEEVVVSPFFVTVVVVKGFAVTTGCLTKPQSGLTVLKNLLATFFHMILLGRNVRKDGGAHFGL